jgi:hypothetical protein
MPRKFSEYYQCSLVGQRAVPGHRRVELILRQGLRVRAFDAGPPLTATRDRECIMLVWTLAPLTILILARLSCSPCCLPQVS